MSILTLEGRMVHYEAIGRGRPLIFIHGWMGSWRYWWPTMQAMAHTRRSFAIDLWGYGDSSRWQEKYSIGDYCELIDAFLTQLGISRPIHIAGHALGAAVALTFAAKDPDSVLGVMAVSAPLDGARINSKLGQRLGTDGLLRLIDRDAIFQPVASEIQKTDSDAIRLTIGQLGDQKLAEKLKEVRCPILFVDGSRDPIVEQGAGNRGCPEKIMSDIQCISLEDCAHFPMLEDPATFSRMLKEFVHGKNVSEIEPKRYWKRRTR